MFTGPTAWSALVKPLDEPLESFRRLLQEVRPKINRPIEIILIGGAAALLSAAVTRITDDVDILASSQTISILEKAGALKFPIQPVAEDQGLSIVPVGLGDLQALAFPAGRH